MNNVLTIEKLFADRIFAIPDDQRGYAWAKQQLTEFVEDLESLPPGKDHYTGTLVLHDRKGDEASRTDDEGRLYTVSDVVAGHLRSACQTCLGSPRTRCRCVAHPARVRLWL